MRPRWLVLAALLLCSACIGPAVPTISPELSATAGASFLPLPRGLGIEVGPDTPSFRPTPSSPSGAEIGAVYPVDLGHCGLGSPFDFDGSLWDATGALDRLGGPVDADDEIGELINATSGQFLLTDADQAQFLTPLGTVIAFGRHAGPKDYPLCD